MRRAEPLIIAAIIVAGMGAIGWGVWTEVGLRRDGTAFCAARGMSFAFGPRSPAYCVAPDGRMYDYRTLRGTT